MAATTIARTTWTDDDGTLTTGTVINNAALQAVYDKIDALFKRTTAGDLTVELENTDVTATSDTGFVARVGSGAAGDAYFQALNGTVTWTWGLDNSDSDAFVLAASAALGTTNILRATSAGVTVPGTLGVTGIATFTGGFTSGAVNNYINDSANANMTTGLTINQGAADNEIAACKSSDVGHALTVESEADTFGMWKKHHATQGGLRLTGFAATGANANAVAIFGMLTDAADTTHTAAGFGVVRVASFVNSAGSGSTVGANGNIFSIDNNGSTKLIVDAEGNLFTDDTAAVYDAYDDPMLALTFEAHSGKKARVQRLWRDYSQYNKQSLIDAGILAPDGPHGERGFVNMSALTRLNTGAVWQLGIKMRQLEAAHRELKRELKRLAA